MYLVISAILFILNFSLYAEENVLITADGIEKPLEKTINPVIYFDEEDIQSTGATYLSDLLRKVSGLQFQSNGGAGQVSSLFMRGTDSRHVLLLIDGIPYQDFTTTSGGPRFEHISLNNVKSIEVIKGAQSVIYGPSALGGVIKITTKSTDDKYWFKFGKGSYDYTSLQMGSGLKRGRVSSNFSFYVEDGDSISAYNRHRVINAEDDPYSNHSVQGRLTFQKSQRSKYFAGARVDSSGLKYDSSTGDDIHPRSDQRKNNFFLGGENRFLDDLWKLEYNFFKTEINRYEKFSKSSDSEYISEEIGGKLKNIFYFSEEMTALFGLEFLEDSAKVMEDIKSENKFERTGAYGGLYWNFKKLSFDTSLRYDYFSDFSNEVSYRLGGALMFNDYFTMKISHGTGVKSPSLYQRFSSYGSSELRSETSRNSEVNGVFKNSFSELSVAVFKTKFENFIDFVGSRYKNNSSVVIEGGELTIKGKVKNLLTTKIALTLLNGRNSMTGEYLTLRPRKKIDYDLNFLLEKMQIGFDGQYVGDRNDYSGRLPSYTLVGARGTYSFSSESQLTILINNILNKKYEEKLGYGTYGRNLKVFYRHEF